jgi:FHA domain
VTAACPNGHESATTDYCDQCGARIADPAAAPAAATPAPAAATPLSAAAQVDAAAADDEVDTAAASPRQPCPVCHAPRTGDDRFCEACGYDFAHPPAVQPAAADGAATAVWEAIASADRSQFDRLAPAGVDFPGSYDARRFPVTGAEVLIGRTHSPDQVPDINLAGSPEDPAISHRHAVLERQADGSYALRDLGSTNGTTLNDDQTPVSTDVAAPLADGDRIHIGAWTMITLKKSVQP